jgi:hypothetical protein
MIQRRGRPKLDPDAVATIAIWYDSRLPLKDQVTVDVGDLDLARASWLLREAADRVDDLDVCPGITVLFKGEPLHIPQEDP